FNWLFFFCPFRSVGTFARALDCSSSIQQPSLHMSAAAASRDVTLFHVMHMLHKHNYNFSNAVCSLVPSTGPVLCRDEMEEWTAAEACIFEEALDRYGKDFNNIQKDYLPWKTLKNIVEFFYMWKTTDRYVQQKRVKAVEAESKLKQVYIPNYKPNPAAINNIKPGMVNGDDGISGRPCESCSATSSSQWYSWGSLYQKRLCQDCWNYWKKYAGLKNPNMTEDSQEGADSDDMLVQQRQKQVNRGNMDKCVRDFSVKGGLVRHGANDRTLFNLMDDTVVSGKPIVKTRSAFCMRVTPLGKLARHLCQHLIRLRHAARSPFWRIDDLAVKRECMLRLGDRSLLEWIQSLKSMRKGLDPKERTNLGRIAHQLGQTVSVRPRILAPTDPALLPHHERVAFPPPPRRKDGSIAYESIPNRRSPVEPMVVNNMSTSLLRRKAYQSHNGLDGPMMKRPMNHLMKGTVDLHPHVTSSPRRLVNHFNGPRGINRAFLAPNRAGIPGASWVDAPDDVYFQATRTTNFAPWCPACRNLQPVWEDFAGWSDDLGINIAQVDTTVSHGLSGRFLVTSLPTIYHVKDGVFRFYRGSRDKDSFISFIEEKKWKEMEPVPGWKSPGAFHMNIVAGFFRISMSLKSLHTKLSEEYGISSWGIYGVFALGTIVVGAILGLILVCLMDYLYPPKGTDDFVEKVKELERQRKEEREKGKDGLEGEEEEEEDEDSQGKDSGTDEKDETYSEEGTESPEELTGSQGESEEDENENGNENENEDEDEDDSAQVEEALEYMSQSKGRSTAAQFFLEEETFGAKPGKSTYDKVVDLLNAASMSEDSRVTNLRQVQELICHQDPNLLDSFLDEVLAFQGDRSPDVRKTVIGFIEEACKKDPEMLPKVMANLQISLVEESPVVAKRVIQAVTQLYKVTLFWLCQAKSIKEVMETTWDYMKNVKEKILHMIDSDNDGIRTHSIKFMEAIILVQTAPEVENPKRKLPDDLCLDDVPLTLKIARPRKLEEEAKHIFDELIKYLTSAHISSVNLMAAMGALSNIARQRQLFIGKVVAALETLHANLPPTLGKSQVSSVRKMLKMHLLNLLKHPASVDYHANIATLLTDLGATQQEVMKYMPKVEELRKRQRVKEEEEEKGAKKAKMQQLEEDEEEDDDDADEEDITSKKRKKSEPVEQEPSAVDVMEEFVFQRLHPPTVADLVLVSMLNLPEEMPSLFASTYTPIAAAGTTAQIRHVARLLATQLASVGIRTNREQQGEAPSAPDSSQVSLKPHQVKPGFFLPLANERIGRNLDICLFSVVIGFISEEMGKRLDLAVSWLFEEYCMLQGFNQIGALIRGGGQLVAEERYNSTLCRLVKAYMDRADHPDRDSLVCELYLQAPLVTDQAVELIKWYCITEDKGESMCGLLKDLILLRPSKQLLFLNALLELTAHENNTVRSHALKVVLQLGERGDLKSIIEEYASMYLRFLILSEPPHLLFGPERGRPEVQSQWMEDSIKVCLYLILALLPNNHDLIHELAQVYVQTSADIKRVILRILEVPVKGMGMNSPALLKLVQTCPKGGETLVTRVIHILTDQTPPSEELVTHVRELYNKRVSDVRFLIPVLTGLTKREVIAALPKLIRLNPIVVKEVIRRLLGLQVEQSPLTPAELLVALHNIDASKCDMKTVIKGRLPTNLCFVERDLYTQEVLALVLQQLMDQDPIPTLLMRTVIQSLTLHPRLIGFVMNILQRLIMKEVWQYPKVWEGFVKCCQRTVPQSYTVLLQLPAPQLKCVFEAAPDLRDPLLRHVMAFTDSQRSHLPNSIMDVLQGNLGDILTEPVSPDSTAGSDAELQIKEDFQDESLDDPMANNQPMPPGT
ncbi:unnamed protein product, partial [Darwinula stevensoni]